MKRNNLIIIGLLIIIILFSIGIVLSLNYHSKENTMLNLTCNDTLYNGDSIEVKLMNVSGNPIANQTINITLTANNGLMNSTYNVTDAKGIMKFELNYPIGNYTINCSFIGNDRYVGNSTVKNITISEVVIQEDSTDSYSTSNGKSDSDIVAWKQAVLGDDYDARADPYNSVYDEEYSKEFEAKALS